MEQTDVRNTLGWRGLPSDWPADWPWPPAGQARPCTRWPPIAAKPLPWPPATWTTSVEAVYFLDFLTGDLRAAALSKQTGKFHAFYQYNVNNDLGVDASKSPRYMMVTGVADLRRTAGAKHRPQQEHLLRGGDHQRHGWGPT